MQSVNTTRVIKNFTLLKGYHPVALGAAMLREGDGCPFKVNVWRVVHTRFRDILPEDLLAVGIHFMSDLQTMYPAIKRGDDVTLVEFDNK